MLYELAPLLFYLLGIILIICLQVLIIRWVFKIDRQLLNQRATVWLLIKLCERHGLDPEEIKTIMTLNDIKQQLPLRQSNNQELLMKLFCDNSANRSNNIYEQHSVVVWFNYGLEEDEPFFELDDRLRKKIEEQGTGLYDGHEIAVDNSDGSFYFYGPSAEDLYNTILPILHSYQFMKGATAHLRFGPSIENARIIEIDI